MTTFLLFLSLPLHGVDLNLDPTSATSDLRPTQLAEVKRRNLNTPTIPNTNMGVSTHICVNPKPCTYQEKLIEGKICIHWSLQYADM